jgi:hypothetical protein|tara:strand:+ start:220 stop:387 length:168 start_codon:yes stop_codon:yes gene_type:complete
MAIAVPIIPHPTEEQLTCLPCLLIITVEGAAQPEMQKRRAIKKEEIFMIISHVDL